MYPSRSGCLPGRSRWGASCWRVAEVARIFRGPSSRQNHMAHINTDSIGARSHAKACHPGGCAWPMVKHYCKLLVAYDDAYNHVRMYHWRARGTRGTDSAPYAVGAGVGVVVSEKLVLGYLGSSPRSGLGLGHNDIVFLVCFCCFCWRAVPASAAEAVLAGAHVGR